MVIFLIGIPNSSTVKWCSAVPPDSFCTNYLIGPLKGFWREGEGQLLEAILYLEVLATVRCDFPLGSYRHNNRNLQKPRVLDSTGNQWGLWCYPQRGILMLSTKRGGRRWLEQTSVKWEFEGFSPLMINFWNIGRIS